MTHRSNRLQRLLNPRSIVFVGGGAIEPAIAYSKALGYAGNIHVVNPRRDEIAGVKCVCSAKDLPTAPDAAFVAVPNQQSIEAVRDLAEAGVGAAVVSCAGFAESGHNDLQDALISAADDMPILGPNCPGFANFLDNVAVMMDNLGVIKAQRGVAVISNGGAYLADISCSDRSLGLAYIIALGNQGNVTVADMLDVVLDDERVYAINLYFESLHDVARLSEVAEKAWKKNIPIVVIKAGRTTAGGRAAQSHTAAMVGDATVASALFRRLGFIEVFSSSEAMETLKMFSIKALPDGRRVGFATSSGTYAALGADAVELAELKLPALTPQRQAMLEPLTESFITPNNPLDLATAQFWPDDDQRRLFDTFLRGDFDIAVQSMSFPAENTWEDESWYRSATIFAQAAKAAGLPAAFVSPTHEGLPRKARDMLTKLGVAPLQGFHDGIRAIAHAVRYAENRQNDARNMCLPVPESISGQASDIDEAQAKNILAEAGVSVPQGIILNGDEIPGNLNYPAVLKLCDSKLLHKTEINAIKLNLNSLEALQRAIQDMSASAAFTEFAHPRFLVEDMIQGVVAELLVGIRHAPDIGQTLTLATGGTEAELFGDTVTMILPVSRDDIDTALRSLKLYPLLNGWRGRPKADTAAACDTIMRLCDFATNNRNVLLELEINPLLLRAEGDGVCIADAVLKRIDEPIP